MSETSDTEMAGDRATVRADGPGPGARQAGRRKNVECGPIKALVVDYDGTLTGSDELEDLVRDALRQARSYWGLRVVLATGRRWVDLVALVPDLDELFDAVVCENGAVLDGPGGHRPLCDPVDPRLGDALAHAGVPVTRGEVLLACPPGHDPVVFDTVSRLGCDDQIVHNRGQVMVLPPGVTKGTGAARALAELGLSPHNAIGMGDAENDRSLLEACGWSAVPGTAVESLRSQADIVLRSGPGAALAELLHDHILAASPVRSRRRHLHLGVDAAGRAMAVATGNVHVLVTGGTRAGKSFFAGALAEQLIEFDHSVLIIDPEGDYARLCGAAGPFVVVPDRAGDDVEHRVAQFLSHRFGSVVLDLSGLALEVQRRVVRRVVGLVDAMRARSGIPQWTFIDEAHLLLTDPQVVQLALGASSLGTCLISYRPHELDRAALDRTEVAVVIPGAAFDDPTAIAAAAAAGGCTPAELADALTGCHVGQAVALDRNTGTCTVLVSLAARQSRHVRHWEKYTRTPLPSDQRFLFRRHSGDMGGAVAADVDEFHRILHRCAPETIHHHAGHHDFSAWFAEALQDPWCAAEIHDAEDRLGPGREGIEKVRAAVLGVVEHRYLR